MLAARSRIREALRPGVQEPTAQRPVSVPRHHRHPVQSSQWHTRSEGNMPGKTPPHRLTPASPAVAAAHTRSPAAPPHTGGRRHANYFHLPLGAPGMGTRTGAQHCPVQNRLLCWREPHTQFVPRLPGPRAHASRLLTPPPGALGSGTPGRQAGRRHGGPPPGTAGASSPRAASALLQTGPRPWTWSYAWETYLGDGRLGVHVPGSRNLLQLVHQLRDGQPLLRVHLQRGAYSGGSSTCSVAQQSSAPPWQR